METFFAQAAELQQVIELMLLGLAACNLLVGVLMITNRLPPRVFSLFSSSGSETLFSSQTGVERRTPRLLRLMGGYILLALGTECVLGWGVLHFQSESSVVGFMIGQSIASLLVAIGIWQEARLWSTEQNRLHKVVLQPSIGLVAGLGLGLVAVFCLGWLFIRGSLHSFVLGGIVLPEFFEWLWFALTVLPLSLALCYAMACWLTQKFTL